MNYPAPIRRLTLPSSFFLDNQLIASASMEFLEVVSFPTFNVVYICPVCSSPWGRWVVDGNGWHISPGFCLKHCPKAMAKAGIDLRPFGPQWLHKYPGGSFQQHQTLTPDRVPAELFLYEFELWSKHYESSDPELL